MEIKASMVKELRDKTGAGMMDAKKALVESDGDIKDWMREDLASLDDGKRYIAYVTLNEDMDYEDACKWIDQFDTGFP